MLSKLLQRVAVLSLFASAALADDGDPQRLLYVAEPGIRNYLEYGGHGVLVYDIDDGHRFLRRIPMGGLNEEGEPTQCERDLCFQRNRPALCLDDSTFDVHGPRHRGMAVGAGVRRGLRSYVDCARW